MTTRVLADRYELRERLGAGGMAEVYRGQDRLLGREVAAKILHPRFARDPQYVARFRREARVAAGITHPHVVAVFDTGEDDGTRYIVMEYVQGRTLQDLIAREAPLPAARTVEIAAAICDGLAAAHSRGLVHRDIKPANIMLTESGGAKVMDFGIARATTSDTLTATAVVMGTAAYLSPEQARGEPVDERSDLYSLGCVLYEMLSGAPPFSGEQPVALAARHVHDAPDPLTDRNSEVPSPLASAVMRCLEKDPDRRFQDAAALREALTEPAGAAPTEAMTHPPGDTAPAREAPARPPRGRFLALLLLLALLGFIGAWAFRAATTPPPPSQDPTAAPGETDPQPEGPPAPEGVDVSPEEPYLALVGVVEEGLLAEEISEDAAAEIMGRAQEAMAEHAEGDLDEALNELQALRDLVMERTPSEISSGRGRAVLEAARALEASIREQTAPEQPDQS